MSNGYDHQGNEHRDLAHLAELCGIDGEWWDGLGNHRRVSEHSLRQLLHGLGVLDSDNATDADINAALSTQQQAPWRRCIPEVRVLYHEEASGTELVVEDAAVMDVWHWHLTQEDGSEHTGSVQPEALAMAGEEGGGVGPSRTQLGGQGLQLRWLALPALPIGYHRLKVQSGGGNAAGLAHLLVAPRRCHEPANPRRLWGLSVQLYSLYSSQTKTMGDFADLNTALQATHRLGGDVLGVNPLHALFAHSPKDASPYSPSSRVFLNPLYVDLQRVPGDTQSASDAPADQNRWIDYSRVATDKYRRLETAFKTFDTAAEFAEQRDRFEQWRTGVGETLQRFATFELLRELSLQQGDGATDWRHWPAPWQAADSDEVLAMVAKHQDRVRYHAWLQWLAHTQLQAASELAQSLGLGIGLYRDLAVGIAANGADAWIDQDVYVHGVHVGAPPDDFSVNGQDWGLPPMNPRTLRAQGYRAFRDMLRANMRAAGALRIDHVMGLARLFCIPADGKPIDGAYVASHLDEMLAVLAIESCRSQCIVIGEDLGTVPEGFRERLHEAGVLSYRLLYFEKHYDGDRHFRRPHEYAAQSLVSVNTHDLPTLTGFWQGTDIQLRQDLNLFPTEELCHQQQHERIADRHRLLDALADQALLPNGADQQQPDKVDMNKTLVDAVHQYLARTPCSILVLNIEDILGQDEQMNLPGTDRDRYPNWRRYPDLAVDAWAEDERFVETAALMRAERP